MMHFRQIKQVFLVFSLITMKDTRMYVYSKNYLLLMFQHVRNWFGIFVPVFLIIHTHYFPVEGKTA